MSILWTRQKELAASNCLSCFKSWVHFQNLLLLLLKDLQCWPSSRVRKGAVHKVHQHFSHYFWQPPPPCQHFFVAFCHHFYLNSRPLPQESVPAWIFSIWFRYKMWRNIGFLLKMAKIGFIFDLKSTELSCNIYFFSWFSVHKLPFLLKVNVSK